MDNEQEERLKAAIKASTDVIMAAWAGVAPKKVNGLPSYICPKCNNGTGSDGDGIAHNTKSQNPGTLKCFKCGFSGDVIDLYREATGRGFHTALRELAALAGIQGNLDSLQLPRIQAPAPMPPAEPEQDFTDDCRRFYEILHGPRGKPCLDWLNGRGISVVTASRFYLGYNPGETWHIPKCKNNRKPWLIIPRDNGPKLRGPYTARCLNVPANAKDDWKWKQAGRTTFFNGKAAMAAPSCFVCEGALDAMSIYEASGGAAAAMALNGTGQDSLWQALVHMRHKGQALPTIILCLDRDENTGKQKGTGAGERATAELAHALNALQMPFIVAGGDLYQGQKDVNAALICNRHGVEDAIRELLYAGLEIGGRAIGYYTTAMGTS